MKLFNHGILLGVLALGLSGCSDETPWGDGAMGEGNIHLRLSATADVSDAVPLLRSSESLIAPAVEDFSIRLEKGDGSYRKEWGSVVDFNAESFRVGSYTLTAFYGDIDDEGFEKPCFIGSTDVTVLEARETQADVTASLANSMVSVTYTDAFKSYFKGFAGTLHSEGHSYVAYPADKEGMPAYLYPGMVDISVQVTDKSDRTVTVQPAKFNALPRHHYHVTIDVRGGQGSGLLDQLVVSFDDSVNQEAVTIDLTEELFTSKAPELAPEGFASGDVIEHLEGVGSPQTVKFNIMAMGGIESAVLTVNSASYTPSFGKEIDLMQADQQTQAILEGAGVVAKGLWKNPDRMAFVDLTDFCKSLPSGRHELTLIVKDKFTRVSQPVSVVFDTNAVSINVAPKVAVYGSGRAMLDVDYNGTDFSSAFSFKAQDDFGNWQECDIISAANVASTRALPVNSYSVTISIPSSTRKEVPVRVYYRGNQKAEVAVPVETPVFDVDYDAFARSIVVRTNPQNSSLKDVIAGAVKIFIDGAEVAENRLVRTDGLVIVTGCEPSRLYRVAASIFPEGSELEYTDVTTESADQVPNGDFEQLSVTYDNITMNQGGEYSNTRGAFLSHWAYNTQNFTISEPVGWSSSNAVTCNLSSDPLNSWFVVPSVFNTSLIWTSTTHKFSAAMGGKTKTDNAYIYSAQNGENAMVIRNVGWNSNGKLPARHDKTKDTESKFYHPDAPSESSFNRSAGTLFLGANGNEGAAFPSRPSALKGYYRYTRDSQDASETGVATVSVLSGSAVIATGTVRLDAAADFTQFSVPLAYNNAADFGKKATSIRIRFSSSDRSEPAVTSYAELHRQESTGAVLVVDNLTFEY